MESGRDKNHLPSEMTEHPVTSWSMLRFIREKCRIGK